MNIASIRRFFKQPAGGAIILLVASILGFWAANSSLSGAYFGLIEAKIPLPGLSANLTFEEFVATGPMALFFLIIMIDIKKELVSGHLSSIKSAALPLISALGGMIVPALIYILMTLTHPDVFRGWAVPIATDAAFTLPIILALSHYVSDGARVWLVALAIFDDVLGIVVIALFYGSAFNYIALLAALIITLGLVVLNRVYIQSLWAYGIGGCLLWVALLVSGVHPTIAGVITGLSLPSYSKLGEIAPLQKAEEVFYPWVNWLILPIFGFVSVGVSLSNMTTEMIFAPVTLGIMLGLLVGKPIGVFGATYLAQKLKIASLPYNTSWEMIFGLSILCGIGFTISLFITGLAFFNTPYLIQAKLGIFVGSILAALIGWAWLRFYCSPIMQLHKYKH
ncbi:Na+/H+ antiporter NhaA [Aristophania vespae]|uniref:Na+/H+ antiporter NhaA n=1 Tax=Aristophania vespae TaxID=2697033 RepID=UPI0023513F96|nr:Na+/H+ antiporter NhaA [Aristophania vespae]UMM64518.1 Na(+)/H(+) antiporter NhaA [Aristophania vespae]